VWQAGNTSSFFLQKPRSTCDFSPGFAIIVARFDLLEGKLPVKVRFAGIVGLITACFAGAAAAADLPARIYTKAPPPVAAYNWSGCYGGGNGGGIWSQNQWWQIGGTGQLFSSSAPNSWLAGVQAGCNYQFSGNWVVGIQGDYDWTDATGSGPHSTLLTLTDQSHLSGLGSVTGRVGYVFWDRWLGYVKGGGAWERVGYLQYFPATGATFATSGATLDGWTVGIGGEYGITPNLSAFLEYDYYDFGTSTLTFAAAGGGSPTINIHETQSVVKAGLNWRFNWLAEPVVAKY
jgi:outer membrane immunogenic protein